MKKLAVAIAVMIVVVMALPVSAAQINLSGKLSTEAAYDFGSGASTTSDLTLELGTTFSGGQTIKGVVVVNPTNWLTKNGNDRGLTSKGIDTNKGIKKAYLEATGPYWMGGPAMITRMGDLDMAYSPFIMETSAIDGASVSGMKVGPVGIDGLYGMSAGTLAVGGRLGVDLGIASMDAALVRVAPTEYDYQARVSATPIDRLVVNGLVAGQTNTKTTAIRANAEYGIGFLPIDVLASVGYRQTGLAFNPTFRSKAKGNPVDGQQGISAVNAALATKIGAFGVTVDGEILGNDDDWKMDDERSIGAAVATKVRGFDIKAGHRLTQAIAEPEDTFTNKTSLGIAMSERALLPNLVVSASYDATVTNFSFADMRHVARAAVGADMGAFRGVSVSALYDSKPVNADTDPSRELTVGYAAPNGVKLGYAYDNLGTSKVSAGMEVGF